MDRIIWQPGSPLRCERCGGYDIDTLDGGRARCSGCGLTGQPVTPGKYEGMGRVLLVLTSCLGVVVVADVFVAWIFAGGMGPGFQGTFGQTVFWSGLLMLLVAGLFAAFGTLSPRMIVVSIGDEMRRRDESFALFSPVTLMALFGIALIGVGALILR